MSFRQKILLIVLVAISMGFVSGKLLLFNGSATNVLPWAALAFMSSFLAATKRQAITLPAVFSFIVSFSFLLFNNNGTTTLAQALKLLLAAAIASLMGLFGGMILGWVGWNVRRLFKTKAGH
jgi:hypothetical protein